MRVLVEDPARAPGGERPGGPPVAVVGLVAWAHPSGRSSRTTLAGWRAASARGLVRADDVVRRRDDGGEVADARRLEAEGAEGSDLGHGTFGRVRHGGRRATGPTASYDSGGRGATDPARTHGHSGPPARLRNFPTGRDVLALRPYLRRTAHARSLRASTIAGRSPPRSCSCRSSRSPSVRPSRSAAPRRRRPHDGGPRAPRRATPGSGRGWRSAVHLRNDGPPVSGELRLAGGAQGRTRFGTVVDLPTRRTRPSCSTPSRRRSVASSRSPSSSASRRSRRPRSTFTIHDASQLIVGSSPRSPGDIVAGIDLAAQPEPASRRRSSRSTPEDLPERVEAWGGLDRLVWQDVDSNRLTDAPAGGPPGLDRRRRPPRHRRRHDRPEHAVRVPRRASCRTGRPPPSTSRPARSPSLLGTVPAGTADLPALGGDAHRRPGAARRAAIASSPPNGRTATGR